MVSKTVEDEEFGFFSKGYTISELIQKFKSYSNVSTSWRELTAHVMEDVKNHGKKRFDLSTMIKCDMDFQKFPFDKHICNLEVS